MYEGPERRSNILTEEQIEVIAERAATKALGKVYEEVGKAVLKKLAWIVGAVAVALLIYLTGKGVQIR